MCCVHGRNEEKENNYRKERTRLRENSIHLGFTKHQQKLQLLVIDIGKTKEYAVVKVNILKALCSIVLKASTKSRKKKDVISDKQNVASNLAKCSCIDC